MDVFLRVNGQGIAVDDAAAHQQLVGLMEQGALGLATIDQWLRRHVR